MFSKDDALEAATFAKLAYSHKSFSKDDNVVYFEEDPDDNSQTFAFRGTDDFWDFIHDASVIQTRDKVFKGLIHSGFLGAWHDLRNYVLKTADKKKKIYITGHSLGAAIAMLCAVEMKGLGYNVQDVYNFGQPRTGNLEFCKYCAESGLTLYRVVNGRDIVTQIPKIDADHWGIPIYMDEGKILKSQKGWNPFFWQRLNDHEMNNYISSLNKIR